MAKTNIFIDGSQAGNTLKQIEADVKKLNNEIRQLPRNSDAYKSKLQELGTASAALKKHRQDINAVSDSYLPAKNNFKSLISGALPFAGVAGLITAGVQGVTAAIGSWYRNNKEMEKSLSTLKSITGASASDIQFYEEKAKEMGRTTTLSAIQAVEAFKLIGSARPDLLKDKEALAAVTKEAVVLSEAAGMELAPAAQALASTMNQFGLGAESSKRIINALAAGSVAGAAEIEDLTATIDRSGTVMKSYNVSVEEGVALAELLSEKNLKGAEAGTQLRNVLLQMSTAKALDDKALAEMEKFGVNLDLVMDKSVPFNQRLKEMSKISGDQTALLRVFGKENIVVGQTILQNVDHFSELTDAVTGTNTAYVQAAINNDNLDGDLKKLSSAWEGLTLSTSAAQSPMREVVQIGTEVLNWLSDLISLFTEWDSLKFEEVLLDFTKYLTYLNPLMFIFGDSVREAIDEQQRMNRMTQEVVEGMKAEADEAATLVQALNQNNQALRNKNITEAESKKIASENSSIINELNSKYPELTKNYDLNKASSQQLSTLQKEITDNLLKQSLAAVQAREAERLLAEMVQKSMEIATARADEQNRWAVTNFALDIFTDDAADLEEQLQKSQKQLEDLPDTMKSIGSRVKNLDLNFGQAFETQTRLIEQSMNKLKSLQMLKDMGGGFLSGMYDKQIKSEKEVLKVLEAQRDEEKNKYIDKEKSTEQSKANENYQQIIAENQRKRDEQIRKAQEEKNRKLEEERKRLEDLQKALDDLANNAAKFKIDIQYESQLARFTDDYQKEIFILENQNKKKYQQDIDTAKKLMKEKGKIGEDAAKQLSALEQLQAEELEFEKEIIRKKYADKAKEKMAEDLDKQYELMDQYEKSLMDIKVAKAYSAVKAVKKGDVEAAKKANQELTNILIQQLELESRLKEKELEKQFFNGEISREEYDLKMEESERVLAEKITEIQTSTQDKILASFKERFEKILESIGKIVDTASQITTAFFDVQKNNIENDKNQAIAAEQEKLDQGIISREEFETKKQAITDESDKKAKAVEIERAKAAKTFAVFNIALSTAEAVMKAVAESPLTFGLPFSAFALATGLAQSAVALSQPLPQYIDGGFRNIIGASDGKTYNAQQVSPLKGGMTPSTPSYALFSESGPEYFVPNNLLKDARVANMVNAIEAIRTNGGSSINNAAGSTGTANDSQLIAVLNANLQMMAALNSKIPNMGVKIGDKQIDDISTRTNELNNFKA